MRDGWGEEEASRRASRIEGGLRVSSQPSPAQLSSIPTNIVNVSTTALRYLNHHPSIADKVSSPQPDNTPLAQATRFHDLNLNLPTLGWYMVRNQSASRVHTTRSKGQRTSSQSNATNSILPVRSSDPANRNILQTSYISISSLKG